MRIKLILAFLVVTATALAAPASNIFKTIRAEARGEEISIEWRTAEESGIYNFEIERKSEDVPTFRRIGWVAAKGGSNAYTYVDKGAFFKMDGGKTYTYRLRTVGSGTEQYSPSVTVTHEVSGVRRSLGMIKELFR